MLDATFDPIRAIQSVVSQQSDFEREEWEKFQSEQRAKVGTINTNSVLGERQIELALRELENGDSDFEYTRLAEGYALLGNFERAVELTRDAEKRAEYQAILDAPEIDCSCNPKHKFIRDEFPAFTIWCCGNCRSLRKC